MVARGTFKDLAAKRTEAVGSAWNISRTRSTVALSFMGRPLPFLSQTDTFPNFCFYVISEWYRWMVVIFGIRAGFTVETLVTNWVSMTQITHRVFSLIEAIFPTLHLLAIGGF